MKVQTFSASRERRSFTAGEAAIEVDARQGGRIASMRIRGMELLVTEQEAPTPMRWGSFPMAPWAGRVRRGRFRFGDREHHLPIDPDGKPHALHGTVWQRPWQWTAENAMTIDLGTDWPFPGRAVQRFELDAESLVLDLELHAESEPFPAFFGWHPWWRRQLRTRTGPAGEPAELIWQPESMLVRDGEGIPGGRVSSPPPAGPWDDCFFGVAEPIRIRWPGAIELSLESSCCCWVVYDERPETFCVEPQNGPPDGFSLDPIPGLPRTHALVEPGKPVVETLRLAWSLSGE